MAAGLAMEGFIPYVNTIATFITRRCYEQVAVDLCLHDLPVRLIANGGGLVYAPLGPTHLAIEDIAIMRALPNMTVTAVCDAEEMVRLMDCTLDWPHPIYIRLAKGGDPVVSRDENGFAIGKAIPMRRRAGARAVVLMATGVMTTNCARRRGASRQGRHRRLAWCISTPSSRSTRRRCSISRATRDWWSRWRRASRSAASAARSTDLLVEQLGTACRRSGGIGLPDAFPHNYGLQERPVRGLRPDAGADRRNGGRRRNKAKVAA